MVQKISLFVLFLWSIANTAQVNNSSPYSYFGMGDITNQTTVSSSTMGGIGTAFSSGSEMNFLNPAGQSALQMTTFNIAGNSKFLNVSDNNASQDTNITTLSYLAIGFPITKKGGFVVGLQPNSSMGYNVIENITDADGDIVEINYYKGKGGTNRLFGSFGYEVIDNLSFGVEGEYIFGKTTNEITNAREAVVYSTKHLFVSKLKGASVKLGTQYKKEIKGLNISTGATVKFGNEINTNSNETFYTFSYINGGEVVKDVLIDNEDISGNVSRPLQWSVGAGIGKANNWYTSINYTAQNATSFHNVISVNNNRVQYNPSSSLNLGGYWIPKVNSLTNYWDRVAYRAGFRYQDTGLAIKPVSATEDFTSINDFGMSFGLGLPVGNQMSKLNIGFEYGSRGGLENGLIKEEYYNIRLSLNLVDKWFKKNKIY